MKKGKLLSAFTSLALFGSILAGAVPFTSYAQDANMQLSMTSEKTSYTLDEIKAGATARVYVKASGDFEADNMAGLQFGFDCSDWSVRPRNLEISYPNQLATNKGDKLSSFAGKSTYGEWTKDFPINEEIKEETGGEIEDPIGYASIANEAINASNPPTVQITTNILNGYFQKGSGSSIAEFDVVFPTDLEAGTYTIDFGTIDNSCAINDHGNTETFNRNGP